MRGATKPSSRLALLVVSGLLVCAGVGVAAPVAADPARVEMNVSAARLSEGDALTVEVIASGDYERIDAPVSEGFDFQQTGRSSQVSIMGSQVQRSERLSYSATPRRRGRWRIQGARLLGGGQVIASAGDIEIEVVDARESLGPAVDPTQAGKIENFVGEAFFVRPEMLIAKPYVGQQAVLSFQLFWTRNQNVNHLSEISEPNYGELHVEDLLAGKTTEHEAVRFGGAPYLRQLTRQVLLSSPKAGVFEVVGPRYRVDVTNFFDSRTFKVGPPPLRIEVRPLPSEGRPASFAAGAVGKLALRGWLLERGREVTRTKLSTGERGVIAYEVAGNGNLYGIGEIAPPALDHMFVERLPDDRDVQVQIDANGPHGRRIWQHTVSFDAPGTYVIPARAFAAFDPSKSATSRPAPRHSPSRSRARRCKAQRSHRQTQRQRKQQRPPRRRSENHQTVHRRSALAAHLASRAPAAEPQAPQASLVPPLRSRCAPWPRTPACRAPRTPLSPRRHGFGRPLSRLGASRS